MSDEIYPDPYKFWMEVLRLNQYRIESRTQIILDGFWDKEIAPSALDFAMAADILEDKGQLPIASLLREIGRIFS